MNGNFNSVGATGADKKTVPVISSNPTASQISYGQKLSASTLTGGTVSVPGTWSFKDAEITAPTVGTRNYVAVFKPTNEVNYTSVEVNISVTTVKATPTITTNPTASQISYGQTLANSTLTGGQASCNGVVIAGVFSFSTSSTAPNVGTVEQTVVFTPTDTTNYNIVNNIGVNVTVVKATPTITTSPTASAITLGNALSTSTLSDGAASVAGGFAFKYPNNTPTSTGNQTVVFTPTDTTNYNTVEITVEVTVGAEQQTQTILGVKRQIGISSSAWERTDDNVNLTPGSNKLTTAPETFTPVSDDFIMDGNVPFYKDIDIVNMRVSDGVVVAHIGDPDFVWTGTNGDNEAVDVMTFYPGHYIKRWQDETHEYIQLSTENFEGATYIAPYYRGTFKSIVDTTTISGTTILRSYAGGTTGASKTIGTFRTHAKANTANKMGIGDWRDFDFLCLYLIKYADYNSQSIVGRGNVDSGSVQTTGYGDAHLTLLGRDGFIGTDGRTPTWCLGQCDPWGNVREFMDGITINSYVAVVATDPDKYVDSAGVNTEGYSQVGYTNLSSSGVYPLQVGYDSNNPLIFFPTVTGGSTSTGLCDYYYCGSGARCVFRGGYCGLGDGAGAFYFSCSYYFSAADASLGCRLLKESA